MRLAALATALLLPLLACSRAPEPVAESRFVEPDRLFQTVEGNLRGHQDLEVIVDIDHARLAQEAGAPMPPAHVILWSDPVLDALVLEQNPIAAVDLPLRALVFEDPETREAAVITNSFDFVMNRHSLPDDPTIRARYESAIETALADLPPASIARFSSDTMPDAGLVVLDSPYDFATTKRRILEAIEAQSDTVSFGEMDFTERAAAYDVELEPLNLILFGGPGPGGKAMASAPTLGLDAFCQKLLIRQDPAGHVQVIFNDLLALADRQQVSGGLPLRVINRRLTKTFSEALEE